MKTPIKALLAILTLSCSILYAEETKPPLKPNPEKMAALKKHHEEMEKLSPEERKQKMEQFLKDHPEAKEKMEEHRKHREKFEKLSPEEKQKKREEFMSNHPEAKAKFEEFKKNHPDWEKKSPEEKRELMKSFKEKKGKNPSPK